MISNTDQETDTIDIELYAKIGNFSVKISEPQTDGCNLLTQGKKCPLIKSQDYTIRYNFAVPAIVPESV